MATLSDNIRDALNNPSTASSSVRSGRTVLKSDLPRVQFCRGCGYRLDGLPDAGECPECGKSFDQSIVTLVGYARGPRLTMISAKPWVATCIAAGLILIAIINVPRKGDDWMTPLVFGILVLAFIASVVWRRVSRVLPGAVTIEFSDDDGARQLDAELGSPPRFEPWGKIDDVRIHHRNDGTGTIRLGYRVGRAGWPIVAVDAELKCSAEELDSLRRYIEFQIAAAKHG